MARALSDGFYRCYRDLVALKLFDDQDRQYRRWVGPQVRALAVRTAGASGAQVSGYIADAREHATRMIRLEVLERRNLGKGKTI